MLMHGLSGSGKTWLAAQLAAHLDAIHVRSDIERKRLAGLGGDARSHSALQGGLYTPERTASLYEHLARCAEYTLRGGHSAIMDATFVRRTDRRLLSDMARRLRVGLRVIHCRAPIDVLKMRIADRDRARTDASEADLAVLDWQTTHTEAIDPDEGLDVIEVDTTTEEPVTGALQALRASGIPVG
jgi:predicted kinase